MPGREKWVVTRGIRLETPNGHTPGNGDQGLDQFPRVVLCTLVFVPFLPLLEEGILRHPTYTPMSEGVCRETDPDPFTREENGKSGSTPLSEIKIRVDDVVWTNQGY